MNIFPISNSPLDEDSGPSKMFDIKGDPPSGMKRIFNIPENMTEEDWHETQYQEFKKNELNQFQKQQFQNYERMRFQQWQMERFQVITYYANYKS